jgi:hypothetical protein
MISAGGRGGSCGCGGGAAYCGSDCVGFDSSKY